MSPAMAGGVVTVVTCVLDRDTMVLSLWITASGGQEQVFRAQVRGESPGNLYYVCPVCADGHVPVGLSFRHTRGHFPLGTPVSEVPVLARPGQDHDGVPVARDREAAYRVARQEWMRTGALSALDELRAQVAYVPPFDARAAVAEDMAAHLRPAPVRRAPARSQVRGALFVFTVWGLLIAIVCILWAVGVLH